jgi:hypothetical protein
VKEATFKHFEIGEFVWLYDAFSDDPVETRIRGGRVTKIVYWVEECGSEALYFIEDTFGQLHTRIPSSMVFEDEESVRGFIRDRGQP